MNLAASLQIEVATQMAFGRCSDHDAAALSMLRQLFELFEQKTGLLRIFDLSLRGEGVQIFIGGESGVGAPDEVSVVTSP